MRSSRLLLCAAAIAAALSLSACEWNLMRLGGEPPVTSGQAVAAAPQQILTKPLADRVVEINGQVEAVFNDIAAAADQGRIAKAQVPAIRQARADAAAKLDQAGDAARAAAAAEAKAREFLAKSEGELHRLHGFLAGASPTGRAPPAPAVSAPTPILPVNPKVGG